MGEALKPVVEEKRKSKRKSLNRDPTQVGPGPDFDWLEESESEYFSDDSDDVPSPPGRFVSRPQGGTVPGKYASQTQAREEWQSQLTNMTDWLETKLDEERQNIRKAVQFLAGGNDHDDHDQEQLSFAQVFRRQKTEFSEHKKQPVT